MVEGIMLQRKMNLDKGWKFYLEEEKLSLSKEIQEVHQMEYDDSAWRQLDLPHDWSIELDFNIADSIVGSEAGYLDGGVGWYRKSLIFPKELQQKRVSLHFGGVYMDSIVYVNGQQVGKYPNGYIPFTYDITGYIVADGISENSIVVRVENKQPSSRWYSGSGIYRSVELIVTDPIHVKEYGVAVTTPNLETEYTEGKVTVNIATEIKNESKDTQEVKVRSIILQYKDHLPATRPLESGNLVIKGGENLVVDQSLVLEDPKLWSCISPNLYSVSIEIILDGEVIDTYETRWGLRWFKFDARDGFFLNGEWMKLKGVCMHHDQGALGAVAYTRAIERQMEIMQEMGVNAIRVTHNPASDELLKICDEKGLMVIDEAFDTWYGGKKQYDLGRFFSQSSHSHPEGSKTMTWAEFDLKKMVKRGRNFPGIIAWSVGNEVSEATGDKRSMETINNMKKWVDEIDQTRGITQGIDKFRFGTGEGDHENIAEVQDSVGFNYAEGNYDLIHEKHPDWVLYGSETSSATKSRGVYSHPDCIGNHDSANHPDYQQSSYDNDHVGWGKTATDSWIEDRDRKYIAGQFIWTGFDYIGEPTPWHNTGGAGHSQSPKSSYFGIVDTAGFPKDDYYLYQSVWKSVEENPMIHILPHWNWENEELRKQVIDENGRIPIRIYSNAPHIELFIDGVSQGIQSFTQRITTYGLNYQQQSEVSDRLYQEWKIAYEYKPNTVIQAIARNNKEEIIAQECIVTAGEASKIHLRADRSIIDADGYDLCYVEVSITDEEGNFMPLAEDEILFHLTGEGKIVGVDNGNPISHERYKSQKDGLWKRKVFNGKAIVIIQSTQADGEWTLTATSEKLTQFSITGVTKYAEENVLSYEAFMAQMGIEINRKAEKLKVQINPAKKEIIAVEDITGVTTVGMGSKLPEKVKVYYKGGLEEEVNVRWNETIIDHTQAGCYKVSGNIEGSDWLASASIRVTGDTSQMRLSENYAKQWTGSQLPAAIASFTNDREGGEDRIEYINDTIISFEQGAINKWTNLQSPPREKDWIGILFAEGGNPIKKYVDSIRVGFLKDCEMSLPKQFVIEYYVPDTEPAIPGCFGHITEGELANDENWKEVENLSPDIDRLHANEMKSLNFSPVHTYALRLNMVRQKQMKGIAITELEVYGKEAIAHDNYEVEVINVEGENIINLFDEELCCYCKVKENKVPTVSVEVTNHAAVTIIPAIKLGESTRIEIVPENGDITKTNTYQIYFLEI